MEPVVVLQWEYLPLGFFEEPIYGKFDQTDLKIENGKVEASTPATAYDTSPGVGDSLYDRVEGYFRATQVLAHRPPKLSAPVTIRIDEKGNRLSEVHSVDGLEMRSGQGTVEPLSTDASGNVLADARRDRLAREQRFRDLVVKHVADETCR